MFYTFVQNNSGADKHKSDLLDHYVVVEARTADQANEVAQRLGIYFDGVRDGRDCRCCGDRWDRVNEDDGTGRPSIWGDPITDEDLRDKNGGIIIHYADGTILREGAPKVNKKGTLELVPRPDWERLQEDD